MIFLAGCRYPYHFCIAGSIGRLRSRFGLLGCFRLSGTIVCGAGAFAGRIVDSYTGLNIIAIDIETDSFPVVFYGVGFDLDTAAHEIISFEYRSDSVCYMMICFFYVVCNHIFKRKHSFDIHISGTGDQIFSIGIFGGELPPDQMATIPQVAAGDTIIFCLYPAGWFDAADASTCFV